MDNRAFWDQRYLDLPILGSGPGSRGYAAVGKTRLVKSIAEANDVRSIADIGCGDLCWVDGETVRKFSYTGYDISPVIIDRNAAAYTHMPAVQFAVHDIASAPLDEQADLVVCFDVLIHQIAREAFDAAIVNLIQSTRKIAIVSYRTPDGGDGAPEVLEDGEELRSLEADFDRMMESLPADRAQGRTARHGSLPDCIALLRDDVIVEAIARYRKQTVYSIIPPGAR